MKSLAIVGSGIAAMGVARYLRNFGYVFNPVSFYYCFDQAGQLRVLFSEVNNTFLQQKIFLK